MVDPEEPLPPRLPGLCGGNGIGGGSDRQQQEEGSNQHQHQQQHQHEHEHPSHRRLEDVDYWRKRAGWADDDETMKSYNQGVYNTYYMGDNANAINGSGGRGNNSKSGGGIR